MMNLIRDAFTILGVFVVSDVVLLSAFWIILTVWDQRGPKQR